MSEIYKEIKGFEHYKISNTGKVLNKMNRSISYRDRWGARVVLSKNNKTKSFSVHRLVYEHFIGEIPNDYCIIHKDKNNNNNRSDNLKLATKKEYLERNLTDSEIQTIVKEYKSGKKLLDIARIIHTKPENISKILKENEIAVSSKNCFRLNYEINHNYFNKINSEKSAYFLGFLYADGNVGENSNSINLVSNDHDMLLNFRNEIGCNRELYKNPCHKNALTLNIASQQMKKDLINLGCVPKKSLILEFPTDQQVPDHLMSHFIRGYFDGDGCIYVGNYSQIKIMSSTKFCAGLANYLNNKFGFMIKLETEPKRHKPETSYIRIWKIKEIRVIREFFYKNSSICLERKRIKFFTV